MLNKIKLFGDQFIDSLTIVDACVSGRPCLYANKKFTEDTGYCESEVLNKNLSILQGDSCVDEVTYFLRNRFDRREACVQDIINYRKNGTRYLNRVVMIPFLSKDGRTLYLGVQNDVTHLRQRATNDQLQKIKGSEICHHYNNQLMKILSRLELCLDNDLEKNSRLIREFNQFSLELEKKSEFDAFEYI